MKEQGKLDPQPGGPRSHRAIARPAVYQGHACHTEPVGVLKHVKLVPLHSVLVTSSLLVTIIVRPGAPSSDALCY